MKLPSWTVGRIAARCGVKVSTLHFYEQKGLIYSMRNNGNQRRYFPETIRRVSIIKTAQKVGISLKEIKRVFDMLPGQRTPTKKDWEKLSTFWRESLDARIKYLQAMRNSLTGCIGCGCLSMDQCPLYNLDDVLEERGPGPVLLEEKASKK